MERIAVAVWGKRISPLFDVSQTIVVLDIEQNEVTKQTMEIFANDNPIHKLSRLQDLSVQTLICGAISRQMDYMLNAGGIRTIPFIAGDKEKVVSAYLTDELPNPVLSMPGCLMRRRRCLNEKSKQEDKTMPNRDGTGPRDQGTNSGAGTGRGQGRRPQGFGVQKGRQKGQCPRAQRCGRRSQNGDRSPGPKDAVSG